MYKSSIFHCYVRYPEGFIIPSFFFTNKNRSGFSSTNSRSICADLHNNQAMKVLLHYKANPNKPDHGGFHSLFPWFGTLLKKEAKNVQFFEVKNLEKIFFGIKCLQIFGHFEAFPLY